MVWVWLGMTKNAPCLIPWRVSSLIPTFLYMVVSKNSGTPKSSILIGFSIINHPFWGTTIFGNTYMDGMGHLFQRFYISSRIHGIFRKPSSSPPMRIEVWKPAKPPNPGGGGVYGKLMVTTMVQTMGTYCKQWKNMVKYDKTMEHIGKKHSKLWCVCKHIFYK